MVPLRNITGTSVFGTGAFSPLITLLVTIPFLGLSYCYLCGVQLPGVLLLLTVTTALFSNERKIERAAIDATATLAPKWRA